MNISKTKGSVHKTFEAFYFDEQGTLCTEAVDVWIKRISLRKAAAEEFQKIFQDIEKNFERISTFICDLVEKWSLTIDDEGTPLEINKENILDLDIDLATKISEAIAEVVFPNFTKAKN